MAETNEYELRMSEMHYREATIYLLAQLNANTIAMHEHLLKIYSESSGSDFKTLLGDAMRYRQHTVNQVMQNMFAKYGNIDINSLFKKGNDGKQNT